MIPFLRNGLAVAFVSLLLTSVSHAAYADFSDTFSGAIGDNWSTGTFGTGATAPTNTGGSVVMDVGSTGGALSVMRSLQTGFNPFEQAFKVSLSGISLTGGPGNGSKPISYIMIGRTTAQTSGGSSGIGNYTPGTVQGGADTAGHVFVQILERTSNVFTVRVGEAASAGNTGSPAEINISGAPTALDWTLGVNGSNRVTWSLSLTGATFTTQSAAGTLSYSGLGTSTLSGVFGASISSTALTDAYVAMGEQNNAGSGNAIGTTQIFSVDSLSVTAIPEPSTFALLAGAAGLSLAGMVRRRR